MLNRPSCYERRGSPNQTYFGSCGNSLRDEAPALIEVVRHARGGAELTDGLESGQHRTVKSISRVASYDENHYISSQQPTSTPLSMCDVSINAGDKKTHICHDP